MAAIQQQERSGARWLTWIFISPENSLMLITDNQLTEEQAAQIQTDYITAHQYDDTPKATVDLFDYLDILKAAVTYIKANNPTLAKWNTYLGTLAWYDAALVRFFISVMARKLSERAEINLTATTETEVLAKLKPFIINTPARRLAKIFFGE